ncbi:C-C motif chemokine 4-like [Carassius carassius]|uniref:C-C motif chemokine 4-like n=1 Tax=Carassius carassius TaxID=217509 RepID=UPI002869259B|nr:C-C motif chemokine 4-like [Carassius carassius]
METRRILMRSLAVAVVIASVIWTTTGDEKVYSCCTKVSTAKVTDPIINFRLQRESLPCVRAVIFETERGDLCRDPRQPWVKEKVKFFRAQRNKTLTSAAPPTSSISDQTHVGGATQATDSSSVTDV